MKLITVLIFVLIIPVFGDAAIRVICVGASITFGAGLEDREHQSFPGQLQQLLGDSYQVLNFGVNGATILRKGNRSYWNTSQFQEVLESKPDVVLIDLGGNDSKLINRSFLNEINQDCQDMIEVFQRLPSHPQVIVMLPVVSFVTDTSGIWDPAIVNRVIPGLKMAATAKGVDILDMHPLLADHAELMPDKIHPDKKGAAMMARQLFNFLNQNLSEEKGDLQDKPSDSKRLDWWHEARFGMFIHWGVYAQFAGVYNGHEQARGGAEWIMNRCKIPVAEYQAKAKEFNPVNYNPDAWVKMAKDAGMKYIVITSKHHDGFALFGSKASKWDVVDATPYGKDLLKPLAEACKKYGIKLGFYYSQAQDWVNPGGSAARKVMKEGWENPDSAKIDQYTKEHSGHWDSIQTTATFDEYIDKVAVPQVREILSNYGDISVLWWDTPTNMTDQAALKLQKLLDLQPNIITNDRLKRPNFPGDTKTPEQNIPDQDALSGQNWETCMTMNGSWGYRDDNKWKPIETLIRNLVDIASKGGNYLLNIGPQPDGTFPDESIERLKKVGQWMDINGEAIYGTQASPFGMLRWGRCTIKEDNGKTNLYFSVFEWPKDGILTIPGLKNKVVSAKLLAIGTSLKTSPVSDGLTIILPFVAPDAIASVIKLEVEGQVVKKAVSVPKKEMKSGALD